MLLNKVTEKEILRVLDGVRVYYVGGCVRDHLMGDPPKDFDFAVVGATPEDMLSRGFSDHGIEHSVFVHRRNKLLRGFEFSLARREKKESTGYKGFSFEFNGVALEEDLSRRDLTINAMAIEVGTKKVIDPFRGDLSLHDRQLLHISESFREDPLRVLRVARFSSRWDWEVAYPTERLCREIVISGELDALTPERVGIEVLKALSGKAPQNFLAYLHRWGALRRVLPELDLYGIPQPEQHHPEIDTGVHLEMVMREVVQVTEDLVTRWGALVHDVGKKVTPLEILPKHIGHEEAGSPIARSLARRLGLSSEFERFGGLVSELHTSVHRSMEMGTGRVARFLALLDGHGDFQLNVNRLADVATADAWGRGGRDSETFYSQEMGTCSDRVYREAHFVRKAGEAFATVRPRPALIQAVQAVPKEEKKKMGDKIRAALHQDRAEAIQEIRKGF